MHWGRCYRQSICWHKTLMDENFSLNILGYNIVLSRASSYKTRGVRSWQYRQSFNPRGIKSTRPIICTQNFRTKFYRRSFLHLFNQLMNFTGTEAFSLDKLRDTLIRLEDTIIFGKCLYHSRFSLNHGTVNFMFSGNGMSNPWVPCIAPFR
jgi:hypothetical protein